MAKVIYKYLVRRFINVTDTDVVLLETGDGLLLETGDGMLIE